MKLNLNQLAAHVRQTLRPVYVVAGEEPLLIQEALDALRQAARQQGYSERQTLDAERGFDWSRLTQASASLSLFATRRLIEMNLPGGAPGDDGGKVLKALAANPAPDTVLIVICGRLDPRQRSSGWYTALENAGASLYVWPIKPAELPQWIAGRLHAAGLAASKEAVQLLAERTEGNLLAAQQDIEKLKLLFPAGKLEGDDVRGAVADSAHFEAFDLMEKVLDGDAAGAVRSLRSLREEGVELPGLLGAWAYTLRQWAGAAALVAQGRDARAALEAVYVYGPRQAPYQKALARAGAQRVRGWLARCAGIDLRLKSTGGEPAAWEELLTCVLAASGAPPRGPARAASP